MEKIYKVRSYWKNNGNGRVYRITQRFGLFNIEYMLKHIDNTDNRFPRRITQKFLEDHYTPLNNKTMKILYGKR